MIVLKLTVVGDSVGVVLPKELLKLLGVVEGDSLFAVETRRGIELMPYNPELFGQSEAAEQVMREDRDALRRLGE